MKKGIYRNLVFIITPFIFLVSSKAALALSGDANGDGVVDEITVTTSSVLVYHPNTGRTASYPVGGGTFAINSIVDTDGIPGVEIVVAKVNQILVIHDRTQRISSYNISPYNVTYGINSVKDTDGVAGKEPAKKSS